MVLRFALIPVAVLVIWMLFNDRRNPEPISQLAKAFFLGVAIALPILFVELFLDQINPFSIGGVYYAAYDTYVIAGFTEETFKLLGVLLFFYGSVHFNEKMDGIVYCAMVSLGFAAIENVLYLANSPSLQNLYSLAIARGIFSVPAHCIFSIFMGFFVAKSKYSKSFLGKVFYILFAWVLAIFLHGTYNFIIMTAGEFADLILAGYVACTFLIGVLMIRSYRKDSARKISF